MLTTLAQHVLLMCWLPDHLDLWMSDVVVTNCNRAAAGAVDVQTRISAIRPDELMPWKSSF